MSRTRPSVPPDAGRPSGDLREAVEHGVETDDRYGQMVARAMVIGLVSHLLFLAVFASLGLWLLSAVNVLSVGIYAVLVVASRRRWEGTMSVVTVELIGHAVVAVWTLGWGSGFHYYVLVPIVFAMHAERRLLRKLLFTFGPSAAYMALSLWLQDATPHDRIPAPYLMGMGVVNLAVFLAIVCYLFALYAQLVNTAELRLRLLAEQDIMTGLQNRGSLMTLAEQVAGAPLGHGTWLVFVDIDLFKSINDRFGHARGDEVIYDVADDIRRVIRQGDKAARWGGEEFLVLLPDADQETAMTVAERIRSVIDNKPRVGPEGSEACIKISVTVGVAERVVGEEFDAALNRADAALYRGKANGRNRVELAASGASSCSSRSR